MQLRYAMGRDASDGGRRPVRSWAYSSAWINLRRLSSPYSGAVWRSVLTNASATRQRQYRSRSLADVGAFANAASITRVHPFQSRYFLSARRIAAATSGSVGVSPVSTSEQNSASSDRLMGHGSPPVQGVLVRSVGLPRVGRLPYTPLATCASATSLGIAHLLAAGPCSPDWPRTCPRISP